MILISWESQWLAVWKIKANFSSLFKASKTSLMLKEHGLIERISKNYPSLLESPKRNKFNRII